jgi:methylglutamate dehydrogenase subunit D
VDSSGITEVGAGRSGRRSGEPGLIVRECTGTDIASLVARRGQAPALSQAVWQTFGVSLPMTPRIAGARDVSFIWAGLDRWLVETKSATVGIESRLEEPLGHFAAICDQSDSRRTLDLRGPKVRDVLAKGLPIDLDPARFGEGDVAMTAAFHVGVHLWQTSAQPIYRVSVVRSYFGSFWHSLASSAAEFGCEFQCE